MEVFVHRASKHWRLFKSKMKNPPFFKARWTHRKVLRRSSKARRWFKLLKKQVTRSTRVGRRKSLISWQLKVKGSFRPLTLALARFSISSERSIPKVLIPRSAMAIARVPVPQATSTMESILM